MLDHGLESFRSAPPTRKAPEADSERLVRAHGFAKRGLLVLMPVTRPGPYGLARALPR